MILVDCCKCGKKVDIEYVSFNNPEMGCLYCQSSRNESLMNKERTYEEWLESVRMFFPYSSF